MASLAIQRLETALQARKFDHTLAQTWRVGSPTSGPDRRLSTTGIDALDGLIDGGWERGEVSEIVGGRSSGRMSVLLATLAAATRRGEVVGLVDALDRFDPLSAVAAGVDLDRVLWVRGPALTVEHARPEGRVQSGRPGPALERVQQAACQAVRAFDLLVRAGGFAVAVLDLVDIPPRCVRALPLATWMRIAHVNEGRDTVGLLMGELPMGRSARGVSVRLTASRRWIGDSRQSRRFAGFTVQADASSTRLGHGSGAILALP